MKAQALKLACTLFAGNAALTGCNTEQAADPVVYESYEIESTGTRQFEWDSDGGTGTIKVLIEEKNLGSAGAEVAEIFFPPGAEGESHVHELEIIYVIEGELGHIVNGEMHVLSAGMTGVVRAPDQVVHKTLSPEGARVLVVWPLGGEVEGFAASEMRERVLVPEGN
jgi:quercetin dioxygenase-like cupin family protein